MTRRSAPPLAPPFPRPVASFVGRRAELDRMLAHVDRDVLLLVHGVGGIGKSELVLRFVDELRSLPAWADATPVHLELRGGASVARVLAELLAATGGRARARRAETPAILAELVRALNSRRMLVFVDDVHHLLHEPIGDALRYLARHVTESRLILASRREIALPADAPPPLVTTLGPLDRASVAALADALADRSDVPRRAADEVMQATRGSPFHVRRLIARHTDAPDGLALAIAELEPDARHVLLLIAVMDQRASIDALRRVLDPPSLDHALRALEQRFLVDVSGDGASVHDLVREPLLASASSEERERAHADAARLCVGEAERRGSVMHALDAVQHALDASDAEGAWRLVEEWHSRLASAGHDHLLMPLLERLGAALPARGVAVELLSARILVRAAAIDEAERVLARIGDRARGAELARASALAGEIAQRRGELARAAQLFERAAEAAHDEGTRFAACVQGASVAALMGHGESARAMIDAGLAALSGPSAHRRARAAWARAVSWMFEERFERAADEASSARRALGAERAGDLGSRLAMLEMLSAIEAEDVERAAEAARGIDEAGLRGRVASLHRAIVAHVRGEPREAAEALSRAHEHFAAQGDVVNAFLAGYHGSAALAAVGSLGEARALAGRTTELARRAGIDALITRSLAHEARLAAEAMAPGEAHALAERVCERAHVGPRSSAIAHTAHAHAFTIEGDIARARAAIASARAAVAAPEMHAARAVIDLEDAAVELVGGDLDRAIALAEAALAHFRDRSRQLEAARARLVLAAAYVARGRRADLLSAESAIARARELADRGALRSIQVGCAIVRAALARKGRDDREADALLAKALRELDPERGSVYADVLLAAIEGDALRWAVPGVAALLAHLGFAASIDSYLVDRHGRRAATEGDAERERAARELFVDETRALLVAQRGSVEIRGRAQQCSLLAALVEARGAVVSPEALYLRAWGAREYHPLNHRNALYVALNRLRACLRDALPEREIVERAGGGWRLADDVDACVRVAARDAGDARKTM